MSSHHINHRGTWGPCQESAWFLAALHLLPSQRHSPQLTTVNKSIKYTDALLELHCGSCCACYLLPVAVSKPNKTNQNQTKPNGQETASESHFAHLKAVSKNSILNHLCLQLVSCRIQTLAAPLPTHTHTHKHRKLILSKGPLEALFLHSRNTPTCRTSEAAASLWSCRSASSSF